MPSSRRTKKAVSPLLARINLCSSLSAAALFEHIETDKCLVPGEDQSLDSWPWPYFMDGNNPPVYDNGRRLEASEIEGLLKDEDCVAEKDYDDGETLPSVEGRSQKNPDS